ncbi:cyclic nucleotide-binding domain-containing protein [bacterium]|nr:cyclic nucleotide-binding domain-containing protein [bacterium]
MTDREHEAQNLILHRGTHRFVTNRDRMEKLRQKARPVKLAADQMYHPPVPGECLVRLGRLRVSQLFADGREITRAVLQAGSAFATMADSAGPGNPESDSYPVTDLILMALGEAEIWSLPPGSLGLGPEPHPTTKRRS